MIEWIIAGVLAAIVTLIGLVAGVIAIHKGRARGKRHAMALRERTSRNDEFDW